MDGHWGEWRRPSTCSVTCGQGLRTLIRICDNPAPLGKGNYCVGNLQKSEACTLQICKILTFSFSDKICDYLLILLYNIHNPVNPYKIICIQGPVNGQWGPWNITSECSVTCGPGKSLNVDLLC